MLGEDYVKFFNLNLFLWRHFPVSSVRLLRVLGGLSITCELSITKNPLKITKNPLTFAQLRLFLFGYGIAVYSFLNCTKFV